MNVLDVLVENPCAAHRGRVRVHVYKKIDTEGDYAGYLMKLPQKEGIAEFNGHLKGDNYTPIKAEQIFNLNIYCGSTATKSIKLLEARGRAGRAQRRLAPAVSAETTRTKVTSASVVRCNLVIVGYGINFLPSVIDINKLYERRLISGNKLTCALG